MDPEVEKLWPRLYGIKGIIAVRGVNLGRSPLLMLRSLLLFFTAAGCFLVLPDYGPSPAVSWMRVHSLDRINKLDQFCSLIWHLKIPLAPNLVYLEYLAHVHGYSIGDFDRTFYQCSILITYVLILFLYRSSLPLLCIAGGLAQFLVFVTSKIHLGNPQLVDVTLPLAFAGYIAFHSSCVFLQAGKLSILCAIGAGLALSQADLVRPYVVYLMPACCLFSWVAFRSRHSRMVFVLTLILTSGVWHTHQLVHHGQLSASNHVGFNLSRAWPIAGLPPLVKESHDQPLADGLWNNIDTLEHKENSDLIRAQIMRFWIENPLQTAVLVFSRLVVFWSGPTDIYDYHPSGDWVHYYKILTTITAAGICIGILVLMFHLRAILRERRVIDQVLVMSGCLFISVSILCVVGERGEEPRFLVSLLPAFVLLPFFLVRVYQLTLGVFLRSCARKLCLALCFMD